MRIVLMAAVLLFSSLSADPILNEARDTAPQEEGILTLFERLEQEHHISEIGTDDSRVKFVHVQGAIEEILAKKQASGEITDLMGVIHTPLPTTPLCTRPNASNLGADPNQWETVLSRAQILREYLRMGSKLYVVYPEGGLEKRNQEQQDVYTAALMEFSPNLIDCTLSIELMDPDMIGATYLFVKNNELYGFSIKARQFLDPSPQTEWGLWFGPVSDRAVSDRIESVFLYLSNVGGPSI